MANSDVVVVSLRCRENTKRYRVVIRPDMTTVVERMTLDTLGVVAWVVDSNPPLSVTECMARGLLMQARLGAMERIETADTVYMLIYLGTV